LAAVFDDRRRSPSLAGVLHRRDARVGGDLIGKIREQLRSLHFPRDRDWLQS
jgi:hypothetical protein